MARQKKNTVDYFPHIIKQGKFIFMLKRKYPLKGYSLFYCMLELLGSSEDHYYDMREPYERDYFIEYCGVDEKTVDLILSDLAAWGEIDKDLYDLGIIWNQKFIDNIEGVYSKRGREIPNKAAIRHRLNINEGVSVPEIPQSKVNKSKTKQKKGEGGTPSHPLLSFIKKNFENLTKIRRQLTSKEAENLVELYPKDLIVEKLQSLENMPDVERKYTTVFISLNRWLQQDFPAWQSKHQAKRKQKQFTPTVEMSAKEKEAAYQGFLKIAKAKGLKLPYIGKS